MCDVITWWYSNVTCDEITWWYSNVTCDVITWWYSNVTFAVITWWYSNVTCDVITWWYSNVTSALKFRNVHVVHVVHKANVTVLKANYCIKSGLSTVFLQLLFGTNNVTSHWSFSLYLWFWCLTHLVHKRNFKSSSRERQHCCHPHVRETSRTISIHVTSTWPMKLTALFITILFKDMWK
jgi:hypothetical protein